MNIALIEAGRAVYGIVGVPVQNKIYIGDVVKQTAWLLEHDELRPHSRPRDVDPDARAEGGCQP